MEASFSTNICNAINMNRFIYKCKKGRSQFYIKEWLWLWFDGNGVFSVYNTLLGFYNWVFILIFDSSNYILEWNGVLLDKIWMHTHNICSIDDF